jgi:ketosteroid isomerase-like protein
MTDWVTHWKQAGEAGEAHTAAEALAADAVLVSPLTERFVFRGRPEIEELLGSVFEVFHTIRFTQDLRSADRAALFAEGRVGGTALQEAQHLELDEEGRIVRLTLMMRPLPAVTAFVRALGPRIARREGRAGAARVLALGGLLLDSTASTGDRRFVPLARPESARRTRGAGAPVRRGHRP